MVKNQAPHLAYLQDIKRIRRMTGIGEWSRYLRVDHLHPEAEMVGQYPVDVQCTIAGMDSSRIITGMAGGRLALTDAKGEIVDVQFPAELNPGEVITGSVFLRNNGTATGTIASILKLAWMPDQAYGGYVNNVPPGATVQFLVESGLNLVMPSQDANLNMAGGILTDPSAADPWTTWRQDSSRSWTIKKTEEEKPKGIPLWMWFTVVGGGVAVVAVAAVMWYQQQQTMMLLLRR